MAATNEKNLPTAELDKSTSHSNSNTDGKDGMYAWVICGVAFIGHTLSAGFSYTMGTYYVVFKEVFNHSAGVTSWVSSLNLGVAFLIGKYRNTVIFNNQFPFFFLRNHTSDIHSILKSGLRCYFLLPYV